MNMPWYNLEEDGTGVLQQRWVENTTVTGYCAVLPNITLLKSGALFIKEGYIWDFGSGAIDTPGVVRASLVHDALCDLIAHGRLSKKARKEADLYYRKMLKEGGVGWFRRQLQYFAIRGYVKFLKGTRG